MVTFSTNIQMVRRRALLFVLVATLGLLGMTAVLTPSVALFIPGSTLCAVTSVLLWVNEQDLAPIGEVKKASLRATGF